MVNTLALCVSCQTITSNSDPKNTDKTTTQPETPAQEISTQNANDVLENQQPARNTELEVSAANAVEYAQILLLASETEGQVAETDSAQE